MATANLTRQEQQGEGPWETQVNFGGEAALHEYYNDCIKNPGHVNFIPADQFNIYHLPAGYRDKNLADLVKIMSDLTVRVSCKYISENRPEMYSGFEIPYPFSSNRGKKVTIVGTGWVYSVLIYPDENYANITCDCNECLNSSSPKTQFAHILIRTAAHVLNDNLEGKNSTCCLFFDNGNSPNDCSSVVKLKRTFRVWSDIEQDRCRMTYATHDLILADKLKKLLEKGKCLNKIVETRYAGPGAKHTLTIIPSHPHGCSKMISVGNYTSRQENVDGWCQYSYTTATCSGTSGAAVLVLGSRMWQWCFNHVHSGKCEDNEGVNFSARGVDYVPR